MWTQVRCISCCWSSLHCSYPSLTLKSLASSYLLFMQSWHGIRAHGLVILGHVKEKRKKVPNFHCQLGVRKVFITTCELKGWSFIAHGSFILMKVCFRGVCWPAGIPPFSNLWKKCNLLCESRNICIFSFIGRGRRGGDLCGARVGKHRLLGVTQSRKNEMLEARLSHPYWEAEQ